MTDKSGSVQMGFFERYLTVWVILCMLVNDDGDRLYTVGTGCSKTCAFHIPLFNDNQRFPWITADRIKELGAGFSFSGFYRPRVD